MLFAFVFLITSSNDANTFIFAISYLTVEIIDACNFIITQTMIFKKMKQDSKGTIVAIEAVLIALWIVGSSICIKKI